jgi:hypothetical protein
MASNFEGRADDGGRKLDYVAAKSYAVEPRQEVDTGFYTGGAWSRQGAFDR